MKFSALSLAILFSTASAAEVTLTTESSDPALNNKGFTSTHEGAGINFLFLSDQSSLKFNYDGHNLTLQDSTTRIPWLLNELSNTLTVGVTDDYPAGISDGYLTVNGSNSVFYLCKPLPYDPYGYSQNTYGVGVYGKDETVPDSCQSVKIKANSDSSAPGSSNKTTSAGKPSASAAPSGAPAASQEYNATVTAKETKYTTIECSTPTTFAYGGSTYTVSSATTLTVKDCSCTATPAAPTPTGSSTPSAPAVNGAQGLKVGAAGIVAAAGMLFI